MNPPIEGMTTIPYGLPLMVDAWFACVVWAATMKENTDAFKKETGYDLSNVLRSRGIEQMIDKATGYDRAVVAAWADWVTKNYWGEDDQNRKRR
jgi:hypothetical protein